MSQRVRTSFAVLKSFREAGHGHMRSHGSIENAFARTPLVNRTHLRPLRSDQRPVAALERIQPKAVERVHGRTVLSELHIGTPNAIHRMPFTSRTHVAGHGLLAPRSEAAIFQFGG